MREILNFTSENDFQSFFSQLAVSEFEDFMAVEGAGGDGGYDGVAGDTCFQSYFPLEKNRTDAAYIAKVDSDLPKAIMTAQAKDVNLMKWILVIPEDLRTSVVLHLQTAGKIHEIECLYWGATKLKALVAKHPYIKDNFPHIFLPPVRQGQRDLEEAFLDLAKKQSFSNGVQIITDHDYQQMRQEVQQKYNRKINSIGVQYPNSSAKQTAAHALNAPMNAELSELTRKKQASDREYQSRVTELVSQAEENLGKSILDLNSRGMFHSGETLVAQRKSKDQLSRDLSRLASLFGKESLNLGEAGSNQEINSEVLD